MSPNLIPFSKQFLIGDEIENINQLLNKDPIYNSINWELDVKNTYKFFRTDKHTTILYRH